MPFDSQGNFTRLHNWEQDRIDDIDIVTDHHDEEDNNFADALSNCFLRNGLAPMEGKLDAGGFNVVNLADGVNDKDATNVGQLTKAMEGVTSVLNGSLMVGDIKVSALQADHNNWVICDGRALSRTDNSELFAAIGTAFGNGNGSTTFNIPDCRGVVVRGLDRSRGLDAGRNLGTYQTDAVPNISGFFRGHRLLGDFGGAMYQEGDYGTSSWSSGGGMPGQNDRVIGFDANKSSSVYGRANEVRVKNIALNYFIKIMED